MLLVDDQELLRSGLRRMLRPRNGFKVVGECSDGSEVPAAVAQLSPDIVVMDLRMKHVEWDRGRAPHSRCEPPASGPGSHDVR